MECPVGLHFPYHLNDAVCGPDYHKVWLPHAQVDAFLPGTSIHMDAGLVVCHADRSS
jgi:hypothetical protein